MSVLPVSTRTAYATATIASGEALSDVIACNGRLLTGVVMPAAWTAADLTFQGSVDGSTFVEVFEAVTDPTPRVVQVEVAASRGVAIPAVFFAPFTHIRVRSGTSGSAVNQGADRALVLSFREFD